MNHVNYNLSLQFSLLDEKENKQKRGKLAKACAKKKTKNLKSTIRNEVIQLIYP